VVIGQNNALGADDDPRPKAGARLFVWGLITKKELKPGFILVGSPFFAWLFLIDLAGEDIDNRWARYFAASAKEPGLWLMPSGASRRVT